MLIDDYVADLGDSLRGPRGPKHDLVVEARDSLVDAAESFEAEGLDRAEAERLAVLEFGSVAEIAPAYQEELAAVAGRRLGILLFISVPTTALLWSLIWQVFPVDVNDWAHKPDWFVPAARALDILQFATGVFGAVGLLLLRRRVRGPRLVTRSLGVLVWASLPLGLGLCLALQFGSRGPAGFDGYPPGVLLSVASLVVWLLQLYCATRCIRVSGPRSVAAPARSLSRS
ncbi:permease prefix domain 1-containing protein [Nonomuraea sp. NPDC046570]|uniref:permease prefix domain 1-containing protein n=1 Tax=Nonomuraea sp. NPDC046570 TaxID=3155255 RepID=UPI0033CF246C